MPKALKWGMLHLYLNKIHHQAFFCWKIFKWNSKPHEIYLIPRAFFRLLASEHLRPHKSDFWLAAFRLVRKIIGGVDYKGVREIMKHSITIFPGNFPRKCDRWKYSPSSFWGRQGRRGPQPSKKNNMKCNKYTIYHEICIYAKSHHPNSVNNSEKKMTSIAQLP